MGTVKPKTKPKRQLRTRSGSIAFPAYIPVTTFGKKYPLDDLVRPFLPRLAPAVMVSHHYAKQADERPPMPVMVDSGGFVSLFERASIEEQDGLGVIRLRGIDEDETRTPSDVLAFQENFADVAFTLDFPIPPSRVNDEGERRLRLTIANAVWALENRRRRDLPLFACVQGWDTESYQRCARQLADRGFDGIAIGGLIPRISDRKLITDVVKVVREIFPTEPLHVFGLGQPGLVRLLFDLGVDSVDSSAYVKLAADGQTWDRKTDASDMSPLDRMHLALANLATASQRALPLGLGQIIFSGLNRQD